MADSTLNRFVASGTQAQRLAFTPSVPVPASGPSPLYVWYETDTGYTYLSPNGGAWVRVSDGLPWKPNCRAKTTAALAANTYANGTAGVGATLTGVALGALAALDGVTLVAGDRLMVANEATGANNGIYVVTQMGTAGLSYILTRATDSDTALELVNAVAKISEGTAAADQEWQCTTNAPITVGTTALVFAQAGAGGAGGLLAANNLSDVASKVASKDNISVKGANIASAATTDLSTATGDFVDVTGTVTITALGTTAAGVERQVRFTGILTLTYNATSLILPTAANITTAANDTARFRSLGTGNWVCVDYGRASGAALVSSGTATDPLFHALLGGI